MRRTAGLSASGLSHGGFRRKVCHIPEERREPGLLLKPGVLGHYKAALVPCCRQCMMEVQGGVCVCWQTQSRSGRPWEKGWSLTPKQHSHPSTARARGRVRRDLSKFLLHASCAQELHRYQMSAAAHEIRFLCSCHSSTLFVVDMEMNRYRDLAHFIFFGILRVFQESEGQFGEWEFGSHYSSRAGANSAVGERPFEV